MLGIFDPTNGGLVARISGIRDALPDTEADIRIELETAEVTRPLVRIVKYPGGILPGDVAVELYRDGQTGSPPDVSISVNSVAGPVLKVKRNGQVKTCNLFDFLP